MLNSQNSSGVEMQYMIEFFTYKTNTSCRCLWVGYQGSMPKQKLRISHLHDHRVNYYCCVVTVCVRQVQQFESRLGHAYWNRHTFWFPSEPQDRFFWVRSVISTLSPYSLCSPPSGHTVVKLSNNQSSSFRNIWVVTSAFSQYSRRGIFTRNLTTM
jgi:hypothetical protein